MWIISALILALVIPSVSYADSFIPICDFNWSVRPWFSEGGNTSSMRYTKIDGRVCLAVDMPRQDDVLRTTWGTDLFDVQLTSESRFKISIHGSPLAKTSPSQPHGGLILIEAGGQENGGDSHWMLDFPGDLFGGNSWKTFVTPPISQAHNPDWAKDADGKIDLNRIDRVMFVLQQEDPSKKLPPFTFYMNDLSATNCQSRKPAITDAVNTSKPESIRPIQRGFIGRKRDAGQTITFSDVTGWRVIQYGGAEAAFVRSEEEPLFGEPVGKLTYRSPAGGGFIRLEPPKPVQLNEFNGLLMWVFGNNWSWMPDPTTPQVIISLELTDKSGEKHLIEMDRMNWKFWSMLHKCVQSDIRKDERHAAYGGDADGILDFPAVLTGIEIRGGSNKEYRSLYFDSIIFRNEKKELPEFNAKFDDLPFPTTKNTILPSLESPVKNTVTKEGATYHFCAKSAESTLDYAYTPKTGTLSDLTVTAGKTKFKPCDGGGPKVDGKPLKAKLVSIKLLKDGSLSTVWSTFDKLKYSLTLRIKGKSLVCDWSSKDTRISELSLGEASGLAKHKLINVPYLSMGQTDNLPVLYNGGVYCLSLLDWYNTNASRFCSRHGEISSTRAAYNGGSQYLKLTDGTRNSLKERQFINISERFEEVLPNIPNPPSPMAELTRKYLHCHVSWTAKDRYQQWLKTWRLYKEHGIDYIQMVQHEDAWSDADTACQGPQEFTMTLDAAPEIGDAQLINYCKEVRKLGWLIGLYSNYTDYSMLGKSWDERNVTRLSNGEWKRVWPPDFNIKPLKAIEMQAYYAPRIVEKFGTNTVYCDVHTCIPPWENVDYEAGTPGAGMLSTTFKAYGKLLMNERKAYGGPVISEGTSHWFYAGLCDGSYGQMGLPDAENQPLLVDFDLRKMHPLEADTGMWSCWAWKDGYYHYMAASIAYGHNGYFPFDSVANAARVYYLTQQLQYRYTQVPVDKILYHSADGFMLPISKALPVDAHLNNQIYTKYKNGLETYANCNKDKPWTVRINGQEINLAPYSWAASGLGLFEYCTEIDGRRVSYCDSPDSTYVDASDKSYNFGTVETAGSLVIRKDDARGLKIIPIDGTVSAVLHNIIAAKVTAFTGDDKVIGPAEMEQAGSDLTIKFRQGARYYMVEK